MYSRAILLLCFLAGLFVEASAQVEHRPARDQSRMQTPEALKLPSRAPLKVPLDKIHIYNPYVIPLKMILVQDSTVKNVELLPGAVFSMYLNNNTHFIIVTGSEANYAYGKLEQQNYDIDWVSGKYVLIPSKVLRY